MVLSALALSSPLAGCIDLPPLKTCAEFPLGIAECSDPCQTYCEAVVESSCSTLFASQQDCQTQCEFDFEGARTGEPGETGRNTLACRITQAQAGNCSAAGLQTSADCASTECRQYCSVIAANCRNEDATTQNQQYDTESQCLTSCETFALTDAEAGSRNSLECRLSQAQMAETLTGTDLAGTCDAAGFQGGEVCGTPCEVYCNTVEKNCIGDLAPYSSTQTCLATCALFPSGSREDATVDGAAGDTAGCRSWHANAAGNSAGDPPIHCPHARVYHPMFCGTRFDMNPPGDWPCFTFCRLVERNCPGVYTDENDCRSACAAFPELVGLDPSQQPQIYPVSSLECPTR